LLLSRASDLDTSINTLILNLSTNDASTSLLESRANTIDGSINLLQGRANSLDTSYNLLVGRANDLDTSYNLLDSRLLTNDASTNLLASRMTTIDASIAIIFNILGKPTGLTASSTTDSITVGWTAPVFSSLLGLTGYQIETLDPANSYALVGTAANVSSGTTTYTTPTTLTPATAYRMRVTSLTPYINAPNTIDVSTLNV
jgi:hypothetical protein